MTKIPYWNWRKPHHKSKLTPKWGEFLGSWQPLARYIEDPVFIYCGMFYFWDIHWNKAKGPFPDLESCEADLLIEGREEPDA